MICKCNRKVFFVYFISEYSELNLCNTKIDIANVEHKMSVVIAVSLVNKGTHWQLQDVCKQLDSNKLSTVCGLFPIANILLSEL